MKMLIDFMILVFVIAMGYSSYTISVNLKNNSKPLYLLICVGGIGIGVGVGVLEENAYLGLQVGIILTLLFLFGSVIGRWQMQKFTSIEERHKKQLKNGKNQ